MPDHEALYEIAEEQGGYFSAALSASLLVHLGRAPPPPLHIRTLGCFEVRQGRRLVPEAALRQRRAGELFRLLLLAERRCLMRDQVLEALWPDKPPGAANTPFHQATSALRRALEPDLPDRFPSRYLEVEGGPVEYQRADGSFRGDLIRILDHDDAQGVLGSEDNDFLTVNQFTVVEDRRERRPDIVLFVNGLPELQVVLESAFDRRRFLDLIRHFIVFEDALASKVCISFPLI